MLGKQKCKILKEIRKKIADENDIPFVTEECTHKGNCRGTCPKCESELRYLEQQLEKRQRLGKRVAVAALCAGMAMGTAGCSAPVSGLQDALQKGSGLIQDLTDSLFSGSRPDYSTIQGYVAPYDGPDIPGEVPTEGEPAIWELEGDVIYVPEEPAEPAP